MSPSACQQLMDKVIGPGLCVACGACVNLCPYFSFYDGRVALTDQCDREEGRCHQVCPRLEDAAPRDETAESPIGPVKDVFTACMPKDGMKPKVQYGGIVTAILTRALKDGLVAAAIVTDKGGDGFPHGVVARDIDAVMANAGSRYAGAAALSAFNRAVNDGWTNLAVVGLPCQATAVRRLAAADGARQAGLSVGLFCTWALDHRRLQAFLAEQDVHRAYRYDIPPPPANVFQVFTPEAVREFPLDMIRPLVMKGCSRCPDMTAEEADISIGAVEGTPGWNTVIVRTDKGAEVIRLMQKKGDLEIRPLPAGNLDHLKDAAALKRRRASSK
ncbi:MAG: Coenzyme F420 hydrogenase/dehydrogenase, beta subunit C-terminal domain [Deltaproteobacteria bacterium]|nr:Coenzyme F420 hydrogenase/dehydrogenase, beta subunit C-terminal domain [Deltaproteobacteria bacterium]